MNLVQKELIVTRLIIKVVLQLNKEEDSEIMVNN